MWNDLIRLERLPRAARTRDDVLFITNMWPDEQRPYYGSFIASQAQSLMAAGVGVDVLYVRGYASSAAYAKAFATLPLTARRRRYDIVHVHYGHTALVSLPIGQRPLITSFCGADLIGHQREHGITRKSAVEAMVFRQLARAATATITKTREMELALPAGLRARNHILPNGVDLERFAPRSRQRARDELGWPRDEKVMLFLGNPDDPRKNVGLARDAAALVAERLPGARLRVAWAVPPHDVPTYLNAADCLLFASRGEGSPNAVKEAMACALPIVATPVGDVPERLGGVDGCWVAAPTPAAFADALIPALHADRAPAARAAVEPLGLHRVAGQLLDIYDQARGRPRRPPAPGAPAPAPKAMASA